MFSTSAARRRIVALTLAVPAAVLGSIGVASPAQAAHPALTDSYTAVGTSHIGSIDADLPIAKTALIETLDLKTLKIRRGTLPIAPQIVSFTALGFIPLRSTVTLVQTAPITGRLKATKQGTLLTTSVSYTIQLSNIQANVLGTWVSLGVGKNCQTADPVTIAASSAAGQNFNILKGGTVTGGYTIGKFQNCAPLNLPDLFGVGSIAVNSLVPGSNNTVSITLSHPHVVNGG